MIKALKKLGIERMYLNIILNGEKLKPFPPNQEGDKGAHSFHSYSTLS
jgi:hypothetical protein